MPVIVSSIPNKLFFLLKEKFFLCFIFTFEIVLFLVAVATENFAWLFSGQITLFIVLFLHILWWKSIFIFNIKKNKIKTKYWFFFSFKIFFLVIFFIGVFFLNKSEVFNQTLIEWKAVLLILFFYTFCGKLDVYFKAIQREKEQLFQLK